MVNKILLVTYKIEKQNHHNIFSLLEYDTLLIAVLRQKEISFVLKSHVTNKVLDKKILQKSH